MTTLKACPMCRTVIDQFGESDTLECPGCAEEIEVRGSFAGRWVVECRVIVEPGAGAASPGSSAETADSLQWRTDRELSSPFCSRFKSRR